jgi:hypothetical protein
MRMLKKERVYKHRARWNWSRAFPVCRGPTLLSRRWKWTRRRHLPGLLSLLCTHHTHQ